jgi:serine phosphatase RsbU (regulator of sigma subunit)
VVNALEGCEGRTPQEICDFLMARAKSFRGGKISDDMTVLAAKIWEKV